MEIQSLKDTSKSKLGLGGDTKNTNSTSRAQCICNFVSKRHTSLLWIYSQNLEYVFKKG